MARLIDADDFLKRLNERPVDYIDPGCDFYYFEETVESVLNETPTVDAVPVVHGRWVLIEEGQNTSVYQCSKCNRMVNVVCDRNLRKRQLAKNYPYCNCGTKMDLEAD